MSDLETRKRALVAESDLCREALKADLENLREYGNGFFKKVDRVRSLTPWLLTAALPLGLPLLKLFGSRKAERPAASSLKGRFAALMLGLRLYRQYGPMVRSLFNQLKTKRRSTAAARSASSEP